VNNILVKIPKSTPRFTFISFCVLDNKKELEQEIVKMIKNKTDEEGEKQPKETAVEQVTNKRKRPLEDSSNTENAKKRKDYQIANKAKKSAEIKSINSVADEIFHQTSKSMPVSSYVQIEQDLVSAQRELRCTILKLDKSDAKVAELEDKIIDQEAALVAKRLLTEDLHKKVAGLEAENRALRAKCTSSSTTTVTASSTGIILNNRFITHLKFGYYLLGFPSASGNEILFLEKLLQFYSKSERPQLPNDIDSYMEDDETSEVCNNILFRHTSLETIP
jgi:hypothetical protein